MIRKNKFFRLNNELTENKLSEVNIAQLDNGILAVTETIPYFNSFALGIGVKVGSRDDYPGKEGISHLLEHCVFRRTKNYESKQINELFERYGAYANAFTTKEYTAYYVRALNHNFQNVWDLLFEIVFQPKFETPDIAKEKAIVKEEIRSYNEDPEEEIFDITDKYLFRKTKLSHPIVGKIKSLESIGRDDIINFYSNFYNNSNIVVAYIGNLDSEVILNRISKTITNPSKSILPTTRKAIKIEKQTFSHTFKRQFLQSHIAFAMLLPKLSTKERYLAAITNLLLGDCSSSRLYKTIREKSALVYNVFSLLTLYSDCSAIYIYSTMHAKKQQKTLEQIRKELEILHQRGFTESELLLAKEQIKSTTIMALENYSERMQSIIKSQLTFGRYEPLAETINIVDSITLDQLNQFVLQNFKPENWSTIIFEPK
ncbi:MAG: M16 family metallopeptidase [Candidatus Kapaibacteriota bacterium]|jgi:predicted Zn-dependent peptidase